jgi:hypothetical protein
VEHSTIILNRNAQLRRLITDDRAVCVLGVSTVRLKRDAAAAGLPPGAPPALPPAAERPIGRYTNVVVDGVGVVYAGRLDAAGVRTVRALATLDADRSTIDMPQPKLWEAIAKAQSLLTFEPDLDVAAAVLDRPLVEVAGMTTVALAQLTEASEEKVVEFRDQVRRLQVAVDATAFATLTLREFVPR